MLAWNFLTYFHLIHQNIYVKNNLESPDTVVRHPNAFLEYLKPLESVLSRFYFYFHRKKLKNTTNIESLHKFNEDGISTRPLGPPRVPPFEYTLVYEKGHPRGPPGAPLLVWLWGIFWKKVVLPWVSNYFPPVVSGRFVGHLPQCMKFPFAKNFVGQVKPRGGGSNLTPTVNVSVL